MTKERLALFHERIALLLTKTNDLLEKPMSEIPTLKMANMYLNHQTEGEIKKNVD